MCHRSVKLKSQPPDGLFYVELGGGGAFDMEKRMNHPHEAWIRNVETWERFRLDDEHKETGTTKIRAYVKANFDREGQTTTRPYARSLYDAIVEAHVSSNAHTGPFGRVIHNPFSAIAFTRRLIYCIWANFLADNDSRFDRNM